MACCKKESSQFTCNWKCIKGILITNRLVFLNVISVLIGGCIGLVLRQFDLPEDLKVWIKIWGELFIRILKMTILPLVTCSIIIGISSMDIRSGGRVGLATMVYHIVVNLLSIILATICTFIVQPGQYWLSGRGTEDKVNITAINNETNFSTTNDADKVNYSDIFADFLRNLFPDNIIRACIENVYTKRTYITESHNGTSNRYSTAELMHRDGTNTMGIIIFSLIIGIAMSVAQEEGQPLKNLLQSLLKIIFIVLKAVIWLSPIAIASLVMSAVIEIEDISSVIGAIGLFMLTSSASTIIHMFGLIPLLYFIVVRKNPFSFWFKYVSAGVLTGIGPPSSAVGVPVLMEKFQETKCVDPRVSDFFLPLAMSVSRSGSAMYIMCTLLFVAQTYPAGITGANIVVAVLMISVLSLAISVVPSASVVLLLTVAQAVNVQIGDRLAIIMALEWLMDRLRTSCNITSSGLGCAMVEKICIRNLNKQRIESEAADVNCNQMLLTENNKQQKEGTC